MTAAPEFTEGPLQVVEEVALDPVTDEERGRRFSIYHEGQVRIVRTAFCLRREDACLYATAPAMYAFLVRLRSEFADGSEEAEEIGALLAQARGEIKTAP